MSKEPNLPFLVPTTSKIITLSDLSIGYVNVPMPSGTVILADTYQYDFRVVEYVDKDDNITKVSLQVAYARYEPSGTRVALTDWTNVERVRIKSE